MIRLLIVGDQPGVRKGLQMWLEAETDLSVIGEAADCETALNLATLLCPDGVLIDCEMLSMNGISTTSAIHAICPQASIVLLSMHDDTLTRTQAEAAGAAAFVAKSVPPETLLATIRQVIH